MKYKLIWKGEVVDKAEDLETAHYLHIEYNLAFKGGVTIEIDEDLIDEDLIE